LRKKKNFLKKNFSSFLCAAENLSPKGFKTVLDIDTQGTFNMCHAAFPEVDLILYLY
jgi:hypothetical protein